MGNIAEVCFLLFCVLASSVALMICMHFLGEGLSFVCIFPLLIMSLRFGIFASWSFICFGVNFFFLAFSYFWCNWEMIINKKTRSWSTKKHYWDEGFMLHVIFLCKKKMAPSFRLVQLDGLQPSILMVFHGSPASLRVNLTGNQSSSMVLNCDELISTI